MTKFLATILVLLAPVAVFAFEPTTVPISPNGIRATIDLPPFMHQRNSGGRDGLGLCVFTSSEVAGYGWQNLEELQGFQKWMENYPGGGWPQKFDKMLAQFCKEKGVEVPPYIQHIGGDTHFLDLCLKTRRAPCLTYAGMDDFYHEYISHMVVLGHFDEEDSCILDNNRPGKWIWQTREQLTSRWHLNTAGKGWAYVFLTTPPPPKEDELAPVPPKPTPKPKPTPWRPLKPWWKKLVLSDGEVIQKLYDDTVFLGAWKNDGWHPAVTQDGWTLKPEGVCPVAPPVQKGFYFTNGGEQVTEEYFTDDSDKPYVTAVVKDIEAKKALWKKLKEHPRAKELAKVHLNVFEASWWASKNVKHNLTVQAAGSNKAVYADNVATVESVFAGLDALNKKTPAPEPRPKVEPKGEPKVTPVPKVEPKVTPVAPSPRPSTPAAPGARDDSITPLNPNPVLVPAWAFWGAVFTLSYGVIRVCKR